MLAWSVCRRFANSKPLFDNEKLIIQINRVSIYSYFLCSFTSRRYYRGQRTHNIGRTHGLIKPHVNINANTKKVQNKYVEEMHLSSKCNHYDSMNFVVSGYDIVLVENFSMFVHNLMNQYRQNVTEMYALPSFDTCVRKMNHAHQRQLDKMDTDITLVNHRRVVQVKDVASNFLPILLQILMNNVPQSVTFEALKHNRKQHEMRYQRNVELDAEQEVLRKMIANK